MECHVVVVVAVVLCEKYVRFRKEQTRLYVQRVVCSLGICSGIVVDGARFYSDCLMSRTTTSMSPQQIHQLGLDKVSRIRQSMEKIADEAAYVGRLDQYIEYSIAWER